MSCLWCGETTPAMHTIPATACDKALQCIMDCAKCDAPTESITLCNTCCPDELKAVPDEISTILTKG